MLVLLGFLAATLLALLLAPAFWRRAVRLTTLRIKDTMPVTDVEIRADKDRVRAGYAIKVHKLESEIEQIRLADARQKIDLNRRDATINELESTLEALRSTHEEAQNAKRVLEQTVTDRLPRLEGRLNEAKKLLFTRDREISDLTGKVEKYMKDLAKARETEAIQKAELDRLARIAALHSRKEPGSNSQPVLEAELDALKIKSLEQADLIAKLQAGDSTASGPQQSELERQLHDLTAQTESQSAEIARLKASLAVFERQVEEDGSEDKIALKARAVSLETQTAQQAATIETLRAELATAKEAIAAQKAQLEQDAKRAAPRKALSERIAQTDDAPGKAASNVETLAIPQGAKTEAAAAAKSHESAATDGEAAPVTPDAPPRKPEAESRPRLLDRISNLARQT